MSALACRRTGRSLLTGLILICLTSRAPAGGPTGFLVDRPPGALGPEARAALALAETIGPTRLLVASNEGRFRDAKGLEFALDGCPVVWVHQGDSADETGPLYSPISLVKLRRFVADGHALFLTGAAAGMVRPLGLETFSLRRSGPGESPYEAGLLPDDPAHPVFRGLIGPAGVVNEVLCNDTGHPAFADFFGSPGPHGMRLARANAGAEDPFVEYELGRGRVVVLGWRVPRYSGSANSHRSNLERLTANTLGYLSSPASWRKVVATARPTEARPASEGPDPNAFTSLELAILDLTQSHGNRYASGPEFLRRLKGLRSERDRLLSGPAGEARTKALTALGAALESLKTSALLANPLIDFDRLLYVERGGGNLGLPANWESNSSLATSGFDNRVCVLSPVRPGGTVSTLYQPTGGRFVGDMELHWNADRLLLSMPGSNGRWQVHELSLDSKADVEIPLIREPDVDNYDACYLPDGRLVFTSTAPFVGVPCVFGSSHVTNLYLRERDGSVRQLTVDQEHNWCPTVLPSGRVLYLRWEYTDLPHSNSRRLFQMNPDGTAQSEYLSSGSYFPNSFFYARPMPGHPTKVVGVATGHHGNARAGRLLIVDPAKGRREAEGVIQEIPGRGKPVDPVVRDTLADGVWPQFLHPYPLDDKYVLVSMKPGPEAPWGIYLVDVFDNILKLAEKPGYALFEPVPVKKQPVPPSIPDRVVPGRKDATVFLSDVYQGGGVRGVPKGTVKALRLVTYHFSYQGMGGLYGSIGMDGPWDIKQVLGTVPVEPDGSAFFRVPAYTPISVQPLDGDGKALQVMRSWFTAMPGEVVSCVGCHESQSHVAPNRPALASGRVPSTLTPWHGPPRGFSFAREVQPVLDRHCVRCHDGKTADLADLRGDRVVQDWTTEISGNVGTQLGGKFSPAYAALHRFVRRPGIESDIHPLAPMEFHADSTELVQILQKGHHGVRLDAESWDRLVTWVDLNAPYHGTWREIVGDAAVDHVAARARAMRAKFTGLDEDPERVPPKAVPGNEGPPTGAPRSRPTASHVAPPAGWPFDETEARRRQGSTGSTSKTLDLGGGVTMELVRVPAGAFQMGSADGPDDERPQSPVTINKPYWVGRCEVTNAQFARFDPTHDSHVEPMHGYQFGIHGYPVNAPDQPVVRVSWASARAFCAWLGRATGKRVDLPTEAQWEYACRAGTATPYAFGTAGADYSKHANLGDQRLREFALETYVRVHLIPKPGKYDDWVPHDDRFDDGTFVSAEVGHYRPNAWGLRDMHGNVWEWTRSVLRPYPYSDGDGRDDPAAAGPRVVRGGSWYDRPARATSSYRLAFAPYQGVYSVGFRVVMDDE